MRFENPLALFQHLLSLNEKFMLQNLPQFRQANATIYTETEALIQAHYQNQQNTEFNTLIGKQAESLVTDSSIHELDGSQVGVYKLAGKLGQGGMGAVYLGERNDGLLAQNVAIKFVYPSIAALVGDDFIQKEAQHLANLEHPNIANMLTVDKTANNLPYMVMEYIEGQTLLEYCNERSLGLTARLHLLRKICNAVHYAHQNMVIHADIKPSNILIDKLGEPKLMDFGIARHINSSPSDNSQQQHTQGEQFRAASGDYASPEQLSNLPLTVATDIYALGKVLQLLLENHPLPAIEKQVLLDKTLTENKGHQFSSVATLEQEISSLLAGRALASIQGNYGYRFKKLLFRNPKTSISLTALLFTLIVSGVALAWQYRQILIEKQVAEQSVQFLENVFTHSSPYEHQNNTITVADLLTQATKKIASKTDLSVASQNRIKIALANALAGVGAYDKSQTLLKSIQNPEPQILIQLLYLQAELAKEMLQFEQALSHSAQALGLINKQKNKHLTAELLSLKATIYRKLRRFDSAKSSNALLQQHAENSGDPAQQVSALIQLSAIFFDQPDYQQSAHYAEIALNTYQDASLADNTLLSTVYYNYGSALEELDRLDEAESYYKKLIALDEKIFGEQHPNTGVNYNLLSYFYHTAGDYPLALSYADKAIAIHQQHAPYSGYEYVDALFNKAHALKALSEPQGAIDALLNAEQVFASFLPQGHSKFVNLYSGLGILYKHISQLEKGVEYLNKALAIVLSEQDVDQTAAASLYGNLGNIAVEEKDFVKAELLYQKRHTIRLAVYGYESRHVVQSLKALARTKRFKEENSTALELITEATLLAEKVYPAEHPSLSGFYAQRALTHKALNQLELAILDINQAIKIAVAGYGEQHFSTFGFKRILADLYLLQGDHKRAYELAKGAYEFQRKLVGKEHAETLRAQNIMTQAAQFL